MWLWSCVCFLILSQKFIENLVASIRKKPRLNDIEAESLLWNLRKELLGLDKKHELHRLLGTLLSKKLSQNEKLNIIEKEYC